MPRIVLLQIFVSSSCASSVDPLSRQKSHVLKLYKKHVFLQSVRRISTSSVHGSRKVDSARYVPASVFAPSTSSPMLLSSLSNSSTDCLQSRCAERRQGRTRPATIRLSQIVRENGQIGRGVVDRPKHQSCNTEALIDFNWNRGELA